METISSKIKVVPVWKQVRKHFAIVWKEKGASGERMVHPNQYHILVGQRYCDKHFTKVLCGDKQEYVFKIRHKMEIRFTSI